MARRLLRLIAIAAAAAQQQTQTTTTFQQGAKKEWTFGDQGRNQNIIGVNLGYLCRVRLKFNVKLK